MNTPNQPMSCVITRGRRIVRLAAAASLMLAAAGCNNRNRFEIPPEATPEARALQMSRAQSLAQDAQRQELAGKDDRAISLYRQALTEWRELPVAWHNMGVLLAKQGKNLEAAEAYKTASELSPSDPISLYNLGTLWEDLGYLDDAARWYDESLLRNQNYLPSLRRSVLVDDLRNKLSQTTAERLKAAILMEREPWWINRFKRIQQRMNERPLNAQSDHAMPSGSRPAPAAAPASTSAPSSATPVPTPGMTPPPAVSPPPEPIPAPTPEPVPAPVPEPMPIDIPPAPAPAPAEPAPPADPN